MLIRLVLAIKNKELLTEVAHYFEDVSDLQIKDLSRNKRVWQTLVRSCGDIFIVSDSMIPKPAESNIGILNNLPEKPITIVLHANNSAEDHAHLLAAGADAVLYSGISTTSLVEAVNTILESRRQFNLMDRYDRKGRLKPKISDFVSHSDQMQIFMEEVHQVVTSNSTLLILGETGVGKEHLAKAIHAESPRSNGPFVTVNTAALPEQLLESELFGHEQGAFTGAIRARRGAFELAHGGTIFLDEIGDMPLHLQAKLLRVLQDYEIVPIGGEEPIWVDVRIIAATNKDLELGIEKGTFRRDLFYRISVVTLTIPPLCQRKEDIPAMTRNFITLFRKKIGREVTGISDDAVQVMCRYDWPGNVRELMNVIERAMLLCLTDTITMKNLPSSIFKTGMQDSNSPLKNLFDTGSWENMTLPEVSREVLQHVERMYLEMILKKAKGRVGEAAQLAGIHPRGLYNKMKELGIKKEPFKTDIDA
ncbi:MAG: sigma 54-interacting transcriptional regulator [Proteobacteria bacterium]|nr:sigma 54-interacting transcriptional regulator [Pseudomonadota bacterium]